MIIPFEKRFDGKKADRHLLHRLTRPDELAGLLNHGLRALPSLRERGAFLTTEATAKAAQRFRVDSDSVAGFMGECCEADRDARTARSMLFDRYRAWCNDNNRRALGKQRFNRRVEVLHPTLVVAPYNGTQSWTGLALRSEAS